jgi:hypothetical protein
MVLNFKVYGVLCSLRKVKNGMEGVRVVEEMYALCCGGECA